MPMPGSSTTAKGEGRTSAGNRMGEECEMCRTTSAAQILAFLSEYMEPEPVEIQSEFTSGEPYVVLDSQVHGARIESIWHETIGAFLMKQKEWKKASKGVDEEEGGVRVRGEDLGDEDMEVDGVEEEEEEVDEEMREFVVSDEEEESAGPRRRRRISSDSEGPADHCTPPPAPPPSPAPSKPSSPRFTLRQSHYRFRVDGLLESGQMGTDDISRLYEHAMRLEESVEGQQQQQQQQRLSKGIVIEVRRPSSSSVNEARARGLRYPAASPTTRSAPVPTVRIVASTRQTLGWPSHDSISVAPLGG